MSVAMFRAPAGFTPKSTSGFVTVLEARKRGLKAVLDESAQRREHPGLGKINRQLWREDHVDATRQRHSAFAEAQSLTRLVHR